MEIGPRVDELEEDGYEISDVHQQPTMESTTRSQS